METPSLKKDTGKEKTRVRRVTRAMVEERTRALAVIAGRVPPYVTQEDYEEAKRELTGERNRIRRQAIPDPAPEPKGEARERPTGSLPVTRQAPFLLSS